MEDYIIIDRWVNFLRDKVEDDVEDLLNEYMSEFNEINNVEMEVSDMDLSHTFFELISELYSIGEG